MFNGHLVGDFVIDPNFQVISSEISPEKRMENGWHLPAIQSPVRRLAAQERNAILPYRIPCLLNC